VKREPDDIEMFYTTTSTCPVYVFSFGCGRCYDTGVVRKSLGQIAGVKIYRNAPCPKCTDL
jgi:hypothetical protein